MWGNGLVVGGVVWGSQPLCGELRYVSCVSICMFALNKKACELAKNTKSVGGVSKSLFFWKGDMTVVFVV